MNFASTRTNAQKRRDFTKSTNSAWNDSALGSRKEREKSRSAQSIGSLASFCEPLMSYLLLTCYCLTRVWFCRVLQVHIEDNTLDVVEGGEPPPPPPQASIIEAFQHFACLYIKYLQIFKKLEMCYDAMVHPQKRTDVKVCARGRRYLQLSAPRVWCYTWTGRFFLWMYDESRKS